MARSRFRLSPVRSPLLGRSWLLSFPPVTKMVQFTGCPPDCSGDGTSLPPGFPIRISWDPSSFAAPPGVSPLTASFIGIWPQGIHPAPYSLVFSTASILFGARCSTRSCNPLPPTDRSLRDEGLRSFTLPALQGRRSGSSPRIAPPDAPIAPRFLSYSAVVKVQIFRSRGSDRSLSGSYLQLLPRERWAIALAGYL